MTIVPRESPNTIFNKLHRFLFTKHHIYPRTIMHCYCENASHRLSLAKKVDVC